MWIRDSSQIHQLGMVMHHDGSLRLAGMVVDNSLKVVVGRDDAEPVGSDNQKIGIHKRQVTNHYLEVVAAMTAENNQLTHALCIEGGNYVCLLYTSNLLSNADKFTKEGTITLKLEPDTARNVAVFSVLSLIHI